MSAQDEPRTPPFMLQGGQTTRSGGAQIGKAEDDETITTHRVVSRRSARGSTSSEISLTPSIYGANPNASTIVAESVQPRKEDTDGKDFDAPPKAIIDAREFENSKSGTGRKVSNFCGTQVDHSLIRKLRQGDNLQQANSDELRQPNDNVEMQSTTQSRDASKTPGQGDSNVLSRVSISKANSPHRSCPQASKQAFLRWAKSFRRTDPRFQILSFFNEVAQAGAENVEHEAPSINSTPTPLQAFDKAGVFSVWRPTSIEAIRKMMLGIATGKGLDIKGKSAKKGRLSAFVPFLQIHEEKHKHMIRTLPRDGRMRLFFPTKRARSVAVSILQRTCNEMVKGFSEAQVILSKSPLLVNGKDCGNETMSSTAIDQDAREQAMQRYMWDMDNPTIAMIDDYSDSQSFGIDLPERLFWEAYIIRQDIARRDDHETGRQSEPAFQDMNFASLRKCKPGKFPRPVVYQSADPSSPMCPLSLLMAYEENGRVLPVVSDFDCFLVGTRGVKYETLLPPEQLDLMSWSVEKIQGILDSPVSTETWTMRWLDVLKKTAGRGFQMKMPKYGFGDKRSYSIMSHAVDHLSKNGAVRHGAECFNYYFPQELDDRFLIISNHLPGNVKWGNVGKLELLSFLSGKIDEGFTFPLNPKNVLCDPGWKAIYDKLVVSQRRHVQGSLDIWFPPESGVREKIEQIHAAHPVGFVQESGRVVPKNRRYSPLASSFNAERKLDGTAAMDLAKFELKHHVVLERAKVKLRAVLCMTSMQRDAGTDESSPDQTDHGIEGMDGGATT